MSWKAIERAVARMARGVRSWDTDADVIVPVDWKVPYDPDDPYTGGELISHARRGLMEGWLIEVKNLKGPTIADMEKVLEHNAAKIERLGVQGKLKNAVVVKRKAGIGVRTPFLLIIPLDDYTVSDTSTNQEG